MKKLGTLYLLWRLKKCYRGEKLWVNYHCLYKEALVISQRKKEPLPKTTVSSQKKELISHKAALWAELQQAAKDYERDVYEKFLQLMLKVDPNGNWKSKSRRNFFIDFFNWRSTAANNKLGTNIPKGIFPTGNNPIDPTKFVTTIQLSKYREEQVKKSR